MVTNENFVLSHFIAKRRIKRSEIPPYSLIRELFYFFNLILATNRETRFFSIGTKFKLIVLEKFCLQIEAAIRNDIELNQWYCLFSRTLCTIEVLIMKIAVNGRKMCSWNNTIYWDRYASGQLYRKTKLNKPIELSRW